MGYYGGLKQEGEIWHYRFVLNGELYRGSTKTSIYEDAVKWLKHYKSSLSLGNIGIHEIPTLEALLKKWSETAVLTNDQQQVDSMNSAIRTHFKPLLKVRIDNLKTEKVRTQLLRYSKSEGIGPGRRGHSAGGSNALLLRLNTLMGFAIDCDYLTKKPYRIKREKPQDKPRTVIRAPKVKEFLIALDANTRSAHIRLAIVLQAGLGLRESEALGAEWQWIDWDSNMIQVVRFVTGELRTKNKEIRSLPLPVWVRDKLLVHWKSVGSPKTGLVLPSDNPGIPHSKRFTAKALERVGKALELQNLTPHGLRASWITSLLHDAKVPLSQTKELAGHANIQTTTKYDQGAEHHRTAMQDLEKAQGMLPALRQGVYRKLKLKLKFKIVTVSESTII